MKDILNCIIISTWIVVVYYSFGLEFERGLGLGLLSLILGLVLIGNIKVSDKINCEVGDESINNRDS